VFVPHVAEAKEIADDLSEAFPGLMPSDMNDKNRRVISEEDIVGLRQCVWIDK